MMTSGPPRVFSGVRALQKPCGPPTHSTHQVVVTDARGSLYQSMHFGLGLFAAPIYYNSNYDNALTPNTADPMGYRYSDTINLKLEYPLNVADPCSAASAHPVKVL